MIDVIGDVDKFNIAAGVNVGFGNEAIDFRDELIEEEVYEWCCEAWNTLYEERDGYGHRDPAKLADHAADIAYVAIGTLLQLFGRDATEAIWAEVQRSNMDKFRHGRQLDENGKVQKPEGWIPPDIEGVLRKFCPHLFESDTTKIDP